MNPSKEECEKTLKNLSSSNVLAISVLAAGYFKPSAAADYITTLENLKGLIIGASNEQQASATFSQFKERWKMKQEY
jgi:hypothetical protein